MISTGSIYYDEIHRRAKYDEWQIFLSEGSKTFEEWKDHWIKTAQKWRKECLDQGLIHTAMYINEIIKGQL